jgi:hypothetical protein
VIEMDKDDIKRLQKKGQESIRYPLMALVAQCYSFVKNTFMRDNLTIGYFQEVFIKILLGNGTMPLELLMYDEETEAFYTIHVVEIRIRDVKYEYSHVDAYGFPAVIIDAATVQSIAYSGTAEELYEFCKHELVPLIELGWLKLAMNNDKGLMPVEHLSPYDLCSVTNLMVLVGRLTNWLQMASSFSKTSGEICLCLDRHVVTDKYFLMSMDLFISFSANVIANTIRQPSDPECLKKYMIRCAPNFHEKHLPEYLVPTVDARLRSIDSTIDIDDIRIMDFTVEPEIWYELLTTAILSPTDK